MTTANSIRSARVGIILLILPWILITCKDSKPPVEVGFTTNLNEPQPHLAELKPDEPRSDLFKKVANEKDLAFLEQIRDAGYDYIELNTSEIAELTSIEFGNALQSIEEVGLKVPVTNLFLPGDLKVVGPQTDAEEQEEYLETVFTRLNQLGTEYVVFGSADARYVPEDYSHEEARRQLVEFSRRAAEISRDYEITILIEHLRREETNLINTVAEAYELMQDVDHPNFELMIDFNHLAEEGEDPGIVLEVADHLHHLHMANPNNRTFPESWDEHPLYEPFFTNLRAIGYDQRISIEATYDHFREESRAAISMMREAFDPGFEIAAIE